MGASFAVFAGFYYWVEKIIGRRYDQLWGAVQFWTLFIGVKTFARASFDAGKSIKRYFIRIAWPITRYSIEKVSILIEYAIPRLEAIVTKRGRCLNNTSQKGLSETGKVTHLMEKGSGGRLSAGVCGLSTAPQRINAKELAYLLGLIESDGSILCYLEKNKGKLYFRSELCIGLKEEDIKLCYWIRRLLGCGKVRKVNHREDTRGYAGAEGKERKISRYQLRSKKLINEKIIKAYEEYPPITRNKAIRVEWFKRCYEKNVLIKKPGKDEVNMNGGKGGYIKDWIIGFIEGDGSFYITKSGVVGFNVVQKEDKEVLEIIREEIGIKRKINERKGIYTITAESREDIERVVSFMTDNKRVRLKGLKKVEFIKWIKYLRRDKSTRYGGMIIPNKY